MEGKTGKHMNGVNKTLYIPLYGKAYVSQKGYFLSDKTAEEIWAKEGFALKGKAKSKWLAYYMGIRGAVFDAWVKQKMAEMPNAAIIHIGCGMDSRVLRVGTSHHKWYDIDFPEVIAERKRYYSESADYQMISGDARECSWLENISEKECAIVVMEGVSMYLTSNELSHLTEKLSNHFEKLVLLMDSYTNMAAKLTKYKNPINEVGVTEVYGMDDPFVLQKDGFTFIKEHSMTPEKYINELKGIEKFIFKNMFAGSFSKRLYRLFEYQKCKVGVEKY